MTARYLQLQLEELKEDPVDTEEEGNDWKRMVPYYFNQFGIPVTVTHLPKFWCPFFRLVRLCRNCGLGKNKTKYIFTMDAIPSTPNSRHGRSICLHLWRTCPGTGTNYQ